MVNKTINPVR